MSVDTLTAALNHSTSAGADRLVLIALADAADPKNGITWLPIIPPKWEKADPSKCITHRANCSKATVIRALQALQESGEIQVRKAQRGQRRLNVYKVCVGLYAEVEVDYEDLPFVIKEPFTAPGDANEGSGTGSQDETSSDEGDGTSRGVTDATSRGDDSSPHGVSPYAGAKRTLIEPAAEPSIETEGEALSSSSPPVPSTAAERERLEVPAAASASAPVSLERAVASLATLTGWDSGSLGVVAPLLQQVPEVLFEETLTATLARRPRNPVGMFVHLLSTAISTWRHDQHQAALDTWDRAFGEAGMERVKREDPERYVMAWAAPALEAARPLPPAAVVSHVLEYLFAYVDDTVERVRLLEVFVRTAERQPAFHSIRDWILSAIDRHRFSYGEVVETVEALVSDEQLRAQLLRFASDVQANVDADEKRRREDVA